MPVYIFLANLIILKSAIEQKYSGGMDKFRKDYSIDENDHHQEDNELICLFGMNIDELDVDSLVENGLHFDEASQFSTDFTIKPRYGEYLWETNWITDNTLYAWHVNTSPSSVKKIQAMENMTFEELSEMHGDSENPFPAIAY